MCIPAWTERSKIQGLPQQDQPIISRDELASLTSARMKSAVRFDRMHVHRVFVLIERAIKLFTVHIHIRIWGQANSGKGGPGA